MLLISRWICFYLVQGTGENQPITNLNPRISANSAFTSEKLNLPQKMAFLLSVCDLSGMS